MVDETLSIDEAVGLGYVLSARVAHDCDVRLLAIKGPILAAQGLRDPQSSVDVDVLVDPRHFERMHDALEAVGWKDEGFYDTPGIVPLHSVTHRHANWPVEIDVHRWFPGLLGDPQVVFDLLWERSTTVNLAHVTLRVPDPVAHTAIAALHHLRDASIAASGDKLPSLAARVSQWPAGERDELSDVAARTGSAETLAPFLTQVGAPAVRSTTDLVVSLEAWRTRSDATTTVVLPWLVGLRRVPWRSRPRFVWRAIWLTDDHFRSWSDVPMDRRAVMRARVARIRRAMRAMPAARADLTASRAREREGE